MLPWSPSEHTAWGVVDREDPRLRGRGLGTSLVSAADVLCDLRPAVSSVDLSFVLCKMGRSGLGHHLSMVKSGHLRSQGDEGHSWVG